MCRGGTGQGKGREARDGWQGVKGLHLLHHLLPDDLSQVDGKPVADNEDAQVPDQPKSRRREGKGRNGVGGRD
jgi:hypothetical protein